MIKAKLNKVDWREFGKIAMGAYEIAPSEFWSMTPLDFWMISDGRALKMGKKRGKQSSMSREDYESLKEKVRSKGHRV